MLPPQFLTPEISRHLPAWGPLVFWTCGTQWPEYGPTLERGWWHFLSKNGLRSDFRSSKYYMLQPTTVSISRAPMNAVTMHSSQDSPNLNPPLNIMLVIRCTNCNYTCLYLIRHFVSKLKMTNLWDAIFPGLQLGIRMKMLERKISCTQ